MNHTGCHQWHSTVFFCDAEKTIQMILLGVGERLGVGRDWNVAWQEHQPVPSGLWDTSHRVSQQK